MDFRYEEPRMACRFRLYSLSHSSKTRADLFDLPYDAEGNLPKLRDFLEKSLLEKETE